MNVSSSTLVINHACIRMLTSLTQQCLNVALDIVTGSIIPLTIALELKMILQNVSLRCVGSILINISPSNFFPDMLFLKRIYQNCQEAALQKVASDGVSWWFSSGTPALPPLRTG